MSTASQPISGTVARTSSPDLATLAWPIERLAEALEALARQAGLVSGGDDQAVSVLPGADRERWVEAVATRLGVEAEPMSCSFDSLEAMVRGGGPALLLLPANESRGEYVLALLRCRLRAVLITPERSIARVSPAQIVAALGDDYEAPIRSPIERLLQRTGVPEERRVRARRALLREHLADTLILVGWLLRPPLAAPMSAYARHLRVVRSVLIVGVLTLLVQGLTILSWALVGNQVLSGIFTSASVSAWGLILFTAIPMQLWLSMSQSRLDLITSAAIKLRLLAGVFGLNPDMVRHQGVGEFLGLVIDAETLDDLAALGGLTTFTALAQIGGAALVLAYNSTVGLFHVALLGLWLALNVGLLLLLVRQSWHWFEVHRVMTDDLVEAMVGHRTRLVQEDRTRWHEAEDRALTNYLHSSTGMDWTKAILAILPRVWTIVALVALSPAILGGTDPQVLAISLGGIILAQQGFSALARSANSIAILVTVWRPVRPLLRSGAAPQNGAPALVTSTDNREPGQLLLMARSLVYRYRAGAEPALRGCSLRVAIGDRVLIEGPSGGGKSTLAAVLAGLRSPEAGLLLIDSFDQPSLGSVAWRRRVAMAPQFHENHVFMGTFAFNLLMGRRWPATPEDLAEAEVVCDELGLGELLAHMPAGMLQQVGETGWQLSHGERSRLFLARALLQGAPLIILDESFGALDPETLDLALACALRRAPAMLLIAHP
ncbi:MAG: ABC transporter ATP-binding protein [Chloroflexales bacterium]